MKLLRRLSDRENDSDDTALCGRRAGLFLAEDRR